MRRKPWESSAPQLNLNSKRKVGADHAESQLAAEKGQGAFFKAWTGNDHPIVTKGRAEEGQGVMLYIGQSQSQNY